MGVQEEQVRKLWSFIVTFFRWFFREPTSECCEYLNVKEFHEKFGIITNDKPTHLTVRKLQERIQCMQEELDEFGQAVSHQDLAAQADALVDLVYFAKGTAVMLGLPWADLWDDVHAANMEKVRGVGPRGHAVDCIKPKGWVGPQTDMILYKAGYDRREFCYWDLSMKCYIFDEKRCCDDKL